MAAKPEAAETVPVPPKSKKMLLVIVVAIVVLALVGGGVLFFLSKKNDANDGEDEQVVHQAVHKVPPTYLPIDNMVVNLADPGGEKVAQVGVTLELSGLNAPERVKAYLPSIRNGILLLISQRTAEELLQREGKEKLAAAILEDVSRYFEPEGGDGKQASAKSKKKAGEAENPVRGVLFSSFIVQ